MQPNLFLIKITNQSLIFILLILIIDQSKLISINHTWSTSPNKCIQTMKTWFCDIFQSDGPIWKSNVLSWLLESQDHFMKCDEWFYAWNAIVIFGYLEWSFQSSSKIKLWVQNWVSTTRNIYWRTLVFKWSSTIIFWYLLNLCNYSKTISLSLSLSLSLI